MNSHIEHIQQKLNERKAENALRELKVSEGLVDFCSNDYLGLASEKSVHKVEDTIQYGSTGSRLISGNNRIIEEVESYLADYYHSESCLIFNSGYNANVGLFSCVAQRADTIIYDELIHASIRDGISLSNANSFSFKHNNIDSLNEKIGLAKGNVFLAIESVYSMDGDMAPLQEIVQICEQRSVALIVDEAHAVGIFGEKGKGLVSEDVFARVITFGKAFGCHGAAVLGSQDLKDYLINFSRAFIYTTALPLQSVKTIIQGHEFLVKNFQRVDELKKLIQCFKSQIKEIGLSLIESMSPIQCVIVPGNDAVKSLAEKIQAKGFDVRPILSPTVPKGEERLRICLHSFNTEEEINELIQIIK